MVGALMMGSLSYTTHPKFPESWDHVGLLLICQFLGRVLGTLEVLSTLLNGKVASSRMQLLITAAVPCPHPSRPPGCVVGKAAHGPHLHLLAQGFLCWLHPSTNDS